MWAEELGECLITTPSSDAVIMGVHTHVSLDNRAKSDHCASIGRDIVEKFKGLREEDTFKYAGSSRQASLVTPDFT